MDLSLRNIGQPQSSHFFEHAIFTKAFRLSSLGSNRSPWTCQVEQKAHAMSMSGKKVATRQDARTSHQGTHVSENMHTRPLQSLRMLLQF